MNKLQVNNNADVLIRNTIKNCVEKGIFIQPKGTSGPCKYYKYYNMAFLI